MNIILKSVFVTEIVIFLTGEIEGIFMNYHLKVLQFSLCLKGGFPSLSGRVFREKHLRKGICYKYKYRLRGK